MNPRKDSCFKPLISIFYQESHRLNQFCYVYLLHMHIPPSLKPSLRFSLYLFLIQSKLSYYSQYWRPQILKDVICLQVQRRATKFVVNDYSINYKSRLTSLYLLPLMYRFEMQDIMFFYQVRQASLKQSPYRLPNFLHLLLHYTASNSKKIKQTFYWSSNRPQHFYYNRIVHPWNGLQQIDMFQSYPSVKIQLMNYVHHLTANFNPDLPCT